MKRMARMATRKPHSWWWDSHISPKNSKWLADNLEDMNRCVKEMLKLIEEEGDSFARKAEMYYQSRPKLITHVEDFYRMYRALAERYDNVTGELRRNIPSELQSQGSGNVDEKLIEENRSSGAEEVEQSSEKNQVPELEELIAEMEAEISQHKHVIDELKSENSLLEAKLTEQEQMILELQYDVASAAEGFLQEKSSLEAQVSDLSLSNASFEAKVISLGDEIKKLEAEDGKNIEKLNTNVEALERKVDKLTSEKEELGAKVSALVTDVKFRDEHLRQLLGWLNRSTFR